MISTGNDIVDLSHTNRERTLQPRFYTKFATPAEIALYPQNEGAGITFESFIWLLWSVKESAYKYFKRYDAGLIFSPVKMVIQDIVVPHSISNFDLPQQSWETDTFNDSWYSGKVAFNSQTLYFKSLISTQVVASIVNDDPLFTGMCWGMQTIANPDSEKQTALVRQFLLARLSNVYPNDHFQITKHATGYPMIFKNGEESGMPVSLAHHGNFVSYCLNLSTILFPR